MSPRARPVAERLLERITKLPDGGCWEWSGTRNAAGYGCLWVGGRYQMAHRLSWELHRSPIAAGLHIDHLCRNTCCVNPDHLEPVTPGENVRRSPTAPPAVNARKTLCVRGHPLTPDNLDSHSLKHGRRACKECMRARVRAYHKKNRASRLEYMAIRRHQARIDGGEVRA
jgi:hypothetical protein